MPDERACRYSNYFLSFFLDHDSGATKFLSVAQGTKLPLKGGSRGIEYRLSSLVEGPIRRSESLNGMPQIS